MTTRIGLISDPHAAPEPVAEAIARFQREGVERIICAGDIAGYNFELEATIALLIEHQCDCIVGNHDQAWLAEHPDETDSISFQFLSQLPQTLHYTIAGKTLNVVHAHPPSEQHGGIKLLDIDGALIPERLTHWSQQLSTLQSDLLVVGHTHQIYAQQLGHVLAINPGSSMYNHSCAILDLPEMTVQFFGLSNKQPLKVWNWSMYYRELNAE